MTQQAEFEAPPRDDAGYLILDAQWRILAVDDAGNLIENGTGALVGRDAREVLGEAALERLRRYRAATFTLENVEYVLIATPFTLPSGTIYVVRAQEVQSTLEHVVSLIVHEVRNPLSAMRALVQGLEEDLGGAESALIYTRRITGEIDRLGRLLGSMAQVARPRGRPPELLRPEVTLERAAAMFRPDLTRRGIAVAVHVTPRSGPIYADPDQVQQVLVNLVANAVEAMPRGGALTLRARLDPRARTVLQVEDTGVGMTDEALERALRPRQSTKSGGMGLGLMIVRSIVRQHQGRMRIVSAPGKGTTVSITFPRAEDAAPATLET